MAKLYVSLTGPLLGLYFPLPIELDDDLKKAAKAVNSSKLKAVWCSLYTEKAAQLCVSQFGGTLLPDSFASQLDYDSDYEFESSVGENLQ